MPIVVGATRPGDTVPARAQSFVRSGEWASAAGAVACIEIGLVNNMPDAALEATERQFVEVLEAASEGRLVRLHLFAMPEVPRGEAAKDYLGKAYAPIARLAETGLDALIVTGNEPRAAALDREPYWDALAGLIDWAEHNTLSTIWSCLAAHAAVLHLDGVKRHQLEDKRFGVFDCDKLAEHPLLAGAPSPFFVPHARCNDLREDELLTHGYRILTRSLHAGVDMFVKQWRSLFVFFQGHPEYDALSLQREYLREIGRYLARERQTYPAVPVNYFDAATQDKLARFEKRAKQQRHPALGSELPALNLRTDIAAGSAATALFRNWLAYLAEDTPAVLPAC